jgi:hypothetical protein
VKVAEPIPGIELDSEWLADEYRWDHQLLVPDHGIVVKFKSADGRSLGVKLRTRGQYKPGHPNKPITGGPGYTLNSFWVDGDHWEHELTLVEYEATIVMLNEEARQLGNAVYYRCSQDMTPVEPYIDPAIMDRLLSGQDARTAGIPRGWKDVYIRELHSQGMGYKELVKLLHISGQTIRRALSHGE